MLRIYIYIYEVRSIFFDLRMDEYRGGYEISRNFFFFPLPNKGDLEDST